MKEISAFACERLTADKISVYRFSPVDNYLCQTGGEEYYLAVREGYPPMTDKIPKGIYRVSKLK